MSAGKDHPTELLTLLKHTLEQADRDAAPVVAAALAVVEAAGDDLVWPDDEEDIGVSREPTSKIPYFDRLLRIAGLQEPRKLLEMKNEWELWSAVEVRVFGARAKNVVVAPLFAAPTAGRLQAIVSAATIRFKSARLVIVPARSDYEKLDDVRRVQQYHGEIEVVPLRSLLTSTVERLRQGGSTPVIDDDEIAFVEPRVTVGGETHRAVHRLSELVAGGDESRILVLLGTAGAGKSTVAAALAKTLRRRRASIKSNSILMHVSEEHWISLEQRRIDISIESVLREALRTHGFDRDDLEQIDVLLANGAIRLIFDSFDEVCSRGGKASPNVILERILQLADVSDSRARILLTSRPEFWNLVDPSLRERCLVAELEPFDSQEIAEYLETRLGERPAARGRATAALKTLPLEMQRLPFVVAAIADAVAEGGEVLTYLESSDSGIRRANPLPGLARIFFNRETAKHNLRLSSEQQTRLVTTLCAEYGPSWTPDELTELAQIDFGLSEAEAIRLSRHAFFESATRTDGAATIRFRYPDIAASLAAVRLAEGLRSASESAGVAPSDSAIVRQLLVRSRADFTGLQRRTAEALRATCSPQSWPVIWSYRTHLRDSPDAQTALFNILLETQSADADGYRVPAFLPQDASFYSASHYVHRGTIAKIDLTTTRFSDVQFRDAELTSCRMSTLTSFDRCVFVHSAIGRDCDGIRGDMFNSSEMDDDTVAASKRWVIFSTMTPDRIARVALQRVVMRFLQATVASAGLESAFASSSNVAEDPFEAVALRILKQAHVVVNDHDRLVLEAKAVASARKLITNGEIVGPFQPVFRDIAMTLAGGRTHEH